MLTKEAFNALLKTLEEPPSTIKFFFATTEPHKVLPTIISRCQRFDLKPIPLNQIVTKLKEIADDQKRDISFDALQKIAKFSDGSLRDGESMLDQIFCYSENFVTEEMINQIFGLIPQDYFFRLDTAVKEKNIQVALYLTDLLYNEGKDFTFFLDQLIDHFRKITILKLQPDADIFLSEASRQGYIESTKIYSLDQCLFILNLLMKSYLQLQKTPSKRCFLEMILIEIITSHSQIPLQVLIQRLTSLENSIKNLPPSLEKVTAPPEEELVEKIKTNPPNEKKEPPPVVVHSSTSEKKDLTLSAVPFSISEDHSPSKELDTMQSPSPTPPQENNTIIKEKKPQSFHDTLINFAAVEMEGIIKKE
jgi:DNA polymerase III subunit gamma/tau